VRTPMSARLALCLLAAAAAPALAQEATPAATAAPAAEAAPAATPDPMAAPVPAGRPSPMGMARINLDDTYLRVVYSRPYKRGRTNIFGTKEAGALVPYGEVWRTGANEATEITVTRDVNVAGKRLPAGTYSLFTTPGAGEWKVHFNSLLGLSGTGYFDAATEKFTPADLPKTDVLVVSVPATTLAPDKEVEQLTIAFEATDAGADMVIRWITTEVRVPFTVVR
jgi:hypothetical protein